MKFLPILVKAIHQKDNQTFSIQWSDGVINDYRLSALQKRCPCAKCFDATTGKRIIENNIEEDVRAVRINNIGRYALKVQFTSGCSTGIYSFAMLRELGGTIDG